MRERLARFMAGRNGVDQLNNFLLATDVLLAILASIIGGGLGRVLYALVMGLLIVIYLRMFSRNLLRRRQENGKYLQLKQRFLARFRLLKERWVQRRDYKFFTCPRCRTTLRVPKGRGKIRIVCRKCGNSFTGKS